MLNTKGMDRDERYMLLGTYTESGNVKRKCIRDCTDKEVSSTSLINRCMKSIFPNITFMTLQGKIASILGIYELEKTKEMHYIYYKTIAKSSTINLSSVQSSVRFWDSMHH